MNERNLAFLYSPEVEALSYPPDCPFKTQRAGCTRLRLQSFGLLGDENHFEFEPRRASFAELKQFHTAHYLEEMQRAAEGDLTVDGLRMGFGGPDTPVFKDMFECGAWACGAGLTGADLLLHGRADVAFNLLGGFHHAFPDRAAGFCYLNDVALACHETGGRRQTGFVSGRGRAPRRRRAGGVLRPQGRDDDFAARERQDAFPVGRF